MLRAIGCMSTESKGHLLLPQICLWTLAKVFLEIWEQMSYPASTAVCVFIKPLAAQQTNGKTGI